MSESKNGHQNTTRKRLAQVKPDIYSQTGWIYDSKIQLK